MILNYSSRFLDTKDNRIVRALPLKVTGEAPAVKGGGRGSRVGEHGPPGAVGQLSTRVWETTSGVQAWVGCFEACPRQHGLFSVGCVRDHPRLNIFLKFTRRKADYSGTRAMAGEGAPVAQIRWEAFGHFCGLEIVLCLWLQSALVFVLNHLGHRVALCDVEIPWKRFWSAGECRAEPVYPARLWQHQAPAWRD